jgi:hypothetical protein
MRSALILGLALLVGAGVLYFAVAPRTKAPVVTKVAAAPKDSPADLVARGQYLATLMACVDCHSPHDNKGEVIKGREYSGHPEGAPLPTWNPEMLKQGNLATISPTLTAFAGPLGVAVAPNLTPDMETGLMGVMTLETLTQIFRTGNHWKGGRPVMPPMPVPFYKDIKDEDLKAIYTFLKSLPAVKNKAPDSTFTPPPAAPAP